MRTFRGLLFIYLFVQFITPLYQLRCQKLALMKGDILIVVTGAKQSQASFNKTKCSISNGSCNYLSFIHTVNCDDLS